MAQKKFDELIAREQKRQNESAVKIAKDIEDKKRLLDRFKPFSELMDRQRELIARSDKLVMLGKGKDYYDEENRKSQWMLVKSGTDDEHDWVVGAIEVKGWGSSEAICKFSFAAVDKADADRVKEFGETPIATGNVLKEVFPPVGGFYDINGTTIEMVAHDLVSSKPFNPLGSFWRQLAIRKIDPLLNAAEVNVRIFEQAAADPDLNPLLVSPLLEQ